MKRNQQNSETRANNVESGRRRTQSLVMLLMLGCAIGFVFGGMALIQKDAAVRQLATAQAANTLAVAKQATTEASLEDARNLAQSLRANQLAMQSVAMRDKDFVVSMLLGLEAYREDNTYQSKSVVLDNARANPKIQIYLSGHKGIVTNVVFNPIYDNIVASASCSQRKQPCDQGEILVHDTNTGRILKRLVGHTNRITSLAFSPNGQILASGSQDKSIILWNMMTGKQIGDPLQGYAYSVNSLAFSPDGRVLASAGCSEPTTEGCLASDVRLWNAKTGQPVGEPFLETTGGIGNVAYSRDGKTLSAISTAGIVSFWDVGTQRVTSTLNTGQSKGGNRVTFPSDDDLVSMGYDSPSIRALLSDIKTYKQIGTLLKTGPSADQTPVSPDGSLLGDFGLEPNGLKGSFCLLAVNPDGTTLALSGQDPSTIILVQEAPPASPLGRHLTHGPVDYGRLALKSDGQVLAVGESDTISLWNPESDELPIHKLNTSYVGAVAFNPAGDKLASGTCIWETFDTCRRAGIVIWDVKTGRPIGDPLIDNNLLFVDDDDSIHISSLAFSPDGHILASAATRERGPLGRANGEQQSILLWDADTGKLISRLADGRSDSISRVVFSPNGDILASTGVDHTILLWDVMTGQKVGTLLGHRAAVSSVVFSSDGKRLASSGYDGKIILWDVASQQSIGALLDSQTSRVYDVAFSPDGKTLASAGSVPSVQLWDLESRQPIGEPLSQTLDAPGYSGDGSIVFSPDGNMLVSSDTEFESLTIWDVDPQSWIDQTCRRAGRNLSRLEWQEYFPGKEYRATCAQWPLEAEPQSIP